MIPGKDQGSDDQQRRDDFLKELEKEMLDKGGKKH